MPYDGTNFEQKPDVFSLEGLIAWLEKQPGETEYNWHNCDGECLAGRYLWATIGRSGYCASGKTFTDVFNTANDPTGNRNYGTVALTRPWTYAAALDRARTLLAGRVS